MAEGGKPVRVRSYRDLVVWQRAMARQAVFGSRRGRVSRKRETRVGRVAQLLLHLSA